MIKHLNKDTYKTKDLKELINIRQELINDIIKLENEELLPDLPDSSSSKPKVIKSTSPDLIWQVRNDNLLMLTDLISNKLKIEIINDELSKEQKQLLKKIIPDYNSKDIVEIIDILSKDEVNKYGSKVKEIINIIAD